MALKKLQDFFWRKLKGFFDKLSRLITGVLFRNWFNLYLVLFYPSLSNYHAECSENFNFLNWITGFENQRLWSSIESGISNFNWKIIWTLIGYYELALLAVNPILPFEITTYQKIEERKRKTYVSSLFHASNEIITFRTTQRCIKKSHL